MPPYREKYPAGSSVRVVSRDKLDAFSSSWKYHNKLKPEQLEYAGQLAEIESVGFYHGGDVLYRLRNVPGSWHEQCLESEPPSQTKAR
jgi:hypothetical protein